MGYKIAVCDDSLADRDYVSDLVRQWAAAQGLEMELDRFSSAEAFWFRYAEEKNYDILLLDIEMGGMDGVTLARRLRRENDTVQIVFITGYSDYIAEGYEVEALHFLVKPVKKEQLLAVLNRAVEKLKKNEQVLHFTVDGQMLRIPVHQIRSVQVQGNYVTIHGRENCTVKKTLSELEAMLDSRFYRVGRSAIVNLTRIRRVTKTDIFLDDGSQIPLPRGAYEGVNRAIISRV